DDVVSGAQLLQHRQPGRAARAVQIDQRLADAATHQPDAAASNRNRRRGKFRHIPSLRIRRAGVKACTKHGGSALCACLEPWCSASIPSVIPKRRKRFVLYGLTCEPASARYPHIRSVAFGSPNVTIARVGSAWTRSSYRQRATW